MARVRAALGGALRFAAAVMIGAVVLVVGQAAESVPNLIPPGAVGEAVLMVVGEVLEMSLAMLVLAAASIPLAAGLRGPRGPGAGAPAPPA